jgi:hypothetical protein
MTDFANSERSQRVNVANLQNSQLSQILKVRLEQHGDVVPLQIQSLGFRRYVLGDLGEPPVGAVGGGSRADATPGTPERREG